MPVFPNGHRRIFSNCSARSLATQPGCSRSAVYRVTHWRWCTGRSSSRTWPRAISRCRFFKRSRLACCFARHSSLSAPPASHCSRGCSVTRSTTSIPVWPRRLRSRNGTEATRRLRRNCSRRQTASWPPAATRPWTRSAAGFHWANGLSATDTVSASAMWSSSPTR